MTTALAVAPNAEVNIKNNPPAVFFEDQLGTKEQWAVACNVFYPDVASLQSVITVFRYCIARRIDIMKKPFYIVTIDGKDNIWPSILLHRIEAHRTNEYAGQDEAIYGDLIDLKYGTETYQVPEWCKVTVYRRKNGHKDAYVAKVFAKEVVMLKDGKPNKMWAKRFCAQMEKCTEALALRKAFPEEVGSEPTAEEMDQGEPFNELKEINKRAKAKAEKRMIAGDPIAAEYTEVEGEVEEAEESEPKVGPDGGTTTLEEKLEAQIEVAQERGDQQTVEETQKVLDKVTEISNDVQPQKLVIHGMKCGWKAADVKAYVLAKHGIEWNDAIDKMSRSVFDSVLETIKTKKPSEVQAQV